MDREMKNDIFSFPPPPGAGLGSGVRPGPLRDLGVS